MNVLYKAQEGPVMPALSLLYLEYDLRLLCQYRLNEILSLLNTVHKRNATQALCTRLILFLLPLNRCDLGITNCSSCIILSLVYHCNKLLFLWNENTLFQHKLKFLYLCMKLKVIVRVMLFEGMAAQVADVRVVYPFKFLILVVEYQFLKMLVRWWRGVDGRSTIETRLEQTVLAIVIVQGIEVLKLLSMVQFGLHEGLICWKNAVVWQFLRLLDV